eukprot:s3291_g3.t1
MGGPGGARAARAHLFDLVGPIKFHKDRLPKTKLSPMMYGWYHNCPWSAQNNLSWFWSEKKAIRKTVVNHVQRVTSAREFGTRLDESPSVIQDLIRDAVQGHRVIGFRE